MSHSAFEARMSIAAKRSSRSRLYLLAAPILAVTAIGLMSGCANRDSITVGSIPDDYRTNHPIVISEKD